MVLKLAVLTIPGLKGLAISNPELINEPCFETLVITPQSVLGQLHAELMNVDAKSFKTAHFKSIGNAFWAGMPAQDISKQETQEMLIHVLNALDIYRERLDSPLTGFKKNHYSAKAEENVCALVQYAAANIDPDYQRLSVLSSPSKAYLARNGFDVNKLPGLTNKDRGHVLSDQLGL